MVVDAFGVPDPTVRVRCGVVERGAGLGDVDRRQRVAVAVGEDPDDLAQAGGHDRPPEVGALVALERDRLERHARRQVHLEHAGAALVRRRRRDHRRFVVVDPEPVQGLRDDLQVLLDRPLQDRRQLLGRVAAPQHRVREGPVDDVVVDLGGLDVRLRVAGRVHGRMVRRDADVRAPRRAQRLHRQAVPEQLVVRGLQRTEPQLQPGRVHPERMPVEGVHHRFVERHPHVDPVPEPAAYDVGVLGETLGGVSVEPAPLVLQHLREVPVEQRDGGLDARRAELVDNPVVEVQAGLVDGAAAGRLHPRPRHRQPVRVHSELTHQRDVLAVAVVMVDGNSAGLAADHRARALAELVPYRTAPAVGVDCALDLERGRGHAPQEVMWERRIRTGSNHPPSVPNCWTGVQPGVSIRLHTARTGPGESTPRT